MEYKYETHVHTSESSACGQSSAVAQVRAYKERGYTGIIITDHFVHHSLKHIPLPWKTRMKILLRGYNAAQKEGKRCGLDIFLGWEFTDYSEDSRGCDFLTYGLDMQFLLKYPKLDELSIEQYSKLVRESGGYLAQAHPYRNRAYIHKKEPVSPQLIDGIEVYNVANSIYENKMAFDFAEKHNLFKQAGSDSHGANMDFCSGIVLKSRAESIFDIIEAIKSNSCSLILPLEWKVGGWGF